MRRALLIARRDYLAAVRTRAFIVSLLLMPILSSLAIGFQVMTAQAERGTTKRYAVVDRTRSFREALEEANTRRTNVEIVDPKTKLLNAPIYGLEFVEPSADEPDAVQQQRLLLSQRHQRGELEGFLDIGPDVLLVAPRTGPPDDRRSVRFQSEKAIERDFSTWAGRVINDAVQARRFAAHGLTPEMIREAQTPVRQQFKGATRLDPASGKIADSTDDHRIVSFVLPAILVAMMLMVVVLSAVPAMQGIVEEKQQRIAEVLLGCVTPFEMMLGKLLGVVAVSLTIATVYLGGGYLVAGRFGAASVVSPALIAWFVVFLVLAVLAYGSLFMAVGAAAGDLKETQSLQMPVTFVAVMPILLLGTILREPNGKVALVGSFIPFSSPMLMMARLSTSAEVPFWQPALAAVGVLVTALACVWAAGRIFRVGLLLQGKGVRMSDLVRWVVRG
ncbi:MAG: ABC transporter permease [Labilithrix sp.]|nr:ABC transporter permease [Labilithrix sp.]MCW5812319.1 ABC transporter permease [Labilithrix sp.]